MWLPTPVYERFPQFFFLLGLLFIANGLYVSFDFNISFVYIGFGLWCSAYGFGIFVVRRFRRAKTATESTAIEDIPSDAAATPG
jgi:hypothetical protein